ncbi:MAG: glycosyltransferase [Acidobacteria bacterium]|nr:glycosyltransferase [Acidobacteriota bacterium]
MKGKLTFLISWYQNDWGLYGRRNEMLTREIARRPEVSGVLHLEPPISEEELEKKEKNPCYDDNLEITKKRFVGFKNESGIYLYTPLVPRGLSPKEREEFLTSQVKKRLEKLGPVENLVLLLYPPNEFSLLLLDQFGEKASLIISDIVDDHRVYYQPGSSLYRQVDERYAKAISRSDIVFTVSKELSSRFSHLNDNIHHLPNGFDPSLFSEKPLKEPEDIASIPLPRILYTGNLLRRLDFPLIREIAHLLPKMHFVFIGELYPKTKKELAGIDNIHLLGPRSYREIANYIEASNLLIMPHEISEETASMDPIKLYLYLASGKPIVATPVAGTEPFKEVIAIAKGKKEFARAIERELAGNSWEKGELRKKAVKGASWRDRVDELFTKITPLLERKARGKDIFYFEYERPEIEELVPRGALRILDIGCGYGKLGEQLKKRGALEVVGVELNPEAGEKARRVIDRVVIGDAEEELKNLPNRYFDAIIFSDSLEHMRHPERLLREAAKKIKRTGRLILSIPNVRHWSVIKRLLEGNWDYEESGILDRDHLRFFTKKSITNLLSETGFKIEEIKNIYHEKVPAEVVNMLKDAGLAVDDLKEEGRVYQYLITASLTPPPLSSIVIPVFNQLPYTKECLESIRKNTGAPYEIIVVDNGSTDGTYEYLKDLYYVRLIRNEENLGFATACNQGIRVARGEYIVLLNNDTIVTPHWLVKLINCAESDEAVGMVGPVSNYVSGPQQIAVASPDAPPKVIINRALATIWQYDRTYYPVDRLVGFALLIKRKVIEEIGLFDESYERGGYEDDDYSLRAKEAGFKLLIARDVFIYHYGSRSFAPNQIDIFAQAARNKKIFLDKWKKEPSPGIILSRRNHRLMKKRKKPLTKERDYREEKPPILLIVHEFPPDEPLGGAGRYTYQLARELIKKGHPITVLAPLPQEKGNPGDIAEYRLSGIKVVRIGPVDSPTDWLGHKDIEKWFADFIEKSGFHLIHFHHLQRIPLSLPLVARKEGIPYIVTLHDFFLLCHHSHLLRFGKNRPCSDASDLIECSFCFRDEYFPHRRDLDLSSFIKERRRLALEILRGAERIFAPSHFVKEIFEKAGLKGKIELRPLGIKPPPKDFKKKEGGIPTLGFIGNITPIKGIDTLLSAVEQLTKKVRILILGEIYDTQNFKDRIGKLLSQSSQLIEVVDKNTPIDEIFAKIDVLLIPSLLETYSFTAREALARGVPVIASRTGALPELIREGENGFLFAPGDVKELTRLIERLVELIEKKSLPNPRYSPPLISDDATFLSEISNKTRPKKKARSNSSLTRNSPGNPGLPLSVDLFHHREEDVANFGKMRKTVYASLGESGRYSGLLPLHLRDGLSEPIMVEGKSGRKLIPVDKKSPPYLYFSIDPTFARGRRKFIIEVTYYDGGKSGFLIEYDSTDSQVTKVPEAPGAFKETKRILREGKGGWKKTFFFIPDACFSGRVNTADFRIKGDLPGDESLIIGEVKITIPKPHLLRKVLWQWLSRSFAKRLKSPKGEIILGEKTIAKGLLLTEAEDGKTKPVVVNGLTAREAMPSPGSPSMMYFSLSPETRHSRRMAVVTVEYWDEGRGKLFLEYDSRDEKVKKVSNLPGAFKETWRVRKKGTKSLREARFYLADALFSGRINGADFRVVGQLSPEERLIIHRVSLHYSVFEVIFHLLFDPRTMYHFAINSIRRIANKFRQLFNGEFKRKIATLLDGREVEVILSEENISSGLLQVDIPPHPSRYERIKGKDARIPIRKKGDDREFMFFNISDPKFIEGNKTPYLTVEYLDVGHSSFHIEYDSYDGSLKKPGYPKGVFKRSLPIPRYNSGEWKKVVIPLPNARFSRCCNGFDFIIVAEPNDPYFNYFHRVSLSYNPPSPLRRFFRKIFLPNRGLENKIELQGLSFPQYEKPVASIIIVSYNSLTYTIECLKAVRRNTEIPYEVIVVDNASSKEVRGVLRSIPGITLLENEENRGFAPACNQGAEFARGKFLCFLNNDTIPTKNWLSSMIEVINNDPQVGIVGSKLVYPQSNLIQHAGVGLTEELIPYHINAYLPADHPEVNREQEVFAVTGACLLIPRELFFEVGKFDEEFINGLEDIDLNLKVRTRGFRVIYTPKSLVYHYEGLSPGRRKNEEANLTRLFAKWKDTLKRYRNRFPTSPTAA